VIAPKDRKLRIEVGYGLEGTLTDVAASRIIRNVITPAFKQGDFDRGVADGVSTIVGATDRRGKRGCALHRAQLGWPERILLGAFIFGIIGLFTFLGIMTPSMGWFLYVFLIPFWAMFPIMIVGTRGALALLASLDAKRRFDPGRGRAAWASIR